MAATRHGVPQTALFGVQSDDAGLVARVLEEALRQPLVPHESTYLGEYWRSACSDGLTVVVRVNEDPMYRQGDPEGERYAEPTVRDCGVLVETGGACLQIEEVLRVLETLPAEVVVVRRESSQPEAK